MSEQPEQRQRFRVRQVDVAGGHPWVLEDAAGILELAESKEVLAADHPEAEIDDSD